MGDDLNKMSEGELKALVSLLDDTDTEIISHVEKKIISLGDEIIPFLEQSWENNFSSTIQTKIENLIHQLQFEGLKERLTYWVKNEQEDILKGLWIINTYLYPDLEFEKVKAEIEQLYYDVWLDFGQSENPSDQIKSLNTAFYEKLKFSSNTKNFHSPSNSMINNVLESRKGNPITLCIVYMLIAQKLKLPVFGVNLPNLFVLTYKTDDVQFYINAFNRGLIFKKEDIDKFIEQLKVNTLDSFYQPCDNLAILQRTLRNLISCFEKIGETEKINEIQELLNSTTHPS